jgi:hypothetical protein
LKFSDFKDATISSEQIGDLAPEDEYSLTLWAFVLKDPPTILFGEHKVSMVSLYVKGDVAYANPLNKSPYKESFCFADAGTYGQFQRCSASEAAKFKMNDR